MSVLNEMSKTLRIMRKMLDEKDRTIANQKLQMEEMSSEFAEDERGSVRACVARIEVSDSSEHARRCEHLE